MPTPSQIKAAQRAGQEEKYFTVHEVVKCVSSDEEGFGEEDIPEELRRGAEAFQAGVAPAGSSGGGSASATRRITQATFNAAVLENMTEFDMDMKSAIREAVAEFTMQEVDLQGVNVQSLSE